MFEFECVVNFQDFVEWFLQLFLYSLKTFIKILWRRSVSYRNQFIDLLFEYVLNKWFLTTLFSSSSHGSLIFFTFRILSFSFTAFFGNNSDGQFICCWFRLLVIWPCLNVCCFIRNSRLCLSLAFTFYLWWIACVLLVWNRLTCDAGNRVLIS